MGPIGKVKGARLGATAVAILLALSGCSVGMDSTGATAAIPEAGVVAPLAVASASPTPTPSSSPATGGWPVAIEKGQGLVPAIAADGTAYAWVADGDDVPRLASFDASGRLRPGWPVDLGPPDSAGTLGVLTDRTVLAVTHEVKDEEDTWALHRLRPDGRELPGWPVRVRGARFVYPPVEGPGGAVWVGWLRTGAPSSVVGAFDRSGKTRSGWPVALAKGYVAQGPGGMRVAGDGTVYVLGYPTSGTGPARLWAFSSRGRTLTGWPITLRSANAGIDLLPGGRLLVATYLPPAIPPQGLCGDARATVLDVIGRNGKSAAGWPRTAAGYASFPEVGPDGAIVYAAGTRLVALGPDGTVRPGWPVAIPRVHPECGGFEVLLGPDGTVGAVAGDRILAFTRGGRRKPGWPFVPPAGFTGSPCVNDAPWVPRPAIDPDGTLYVPTWAEAQDAEGFGRVGITAVDVLGRVIPGWPYAAAARSGGGTGAEALVFAAGHLYATLVQDCTGTATLVALEPDGSIAR